MKINRVKLVYFSPTGSTKRIMEEIAKGIEAPVEQVDLTRPEAKVRDFEDFGDELAIIGSPVYAGRVPVEAVRRLRRLKAHNTPAVTLVVYGNRAYEDALLELRDLSAEIGFRPVAAAAFIGEHSYSTPAAPIASGRPDRDDLEKAGAFGSMVVGKLRHMRPSGENVPVGVPGNFPYKELRMLSEISPLTREALCERCGDCVTVCPTAAITLKKEVTTDNTVCIRCCACIRACPAGARVMADSRILQAAAQLSEKCRQRKEPEMFL